MSDKIRCELHLAMNEDGAFAVAEDEGDAVERLIENEGGCNIRVVKLTVAMTPPATVEAEVDVPDDAGRTEAVESAAA